LTTITEPVAQPLAELATIGLRVEAPDIHEALAVFPIFGPDARAVYRSYADAFADGATIKELSGGASVNDLIVHNGTDQALLLYEGEEVLGAQQNRTFDVSVLVAAGAWARVPVSCVEQGRWDSTRASESFTAAPHVAYPALRRQKNLQVRRSVAVGQEPRAAQGAVWSEVAAKSDRLSVDSETSAMQDLYERFHDALEAFDDRVTLRDGQVGAIVAIGCRFVVLDCVSRPDVFAHLHGPLLRGYALDALESRRAETPTVDAARAFIDCALRAPATTRPAIGLGVDTRFTTVGVSGAALVHDDELVQLTAFPEDGGATSDRHGIRRPSRRRQR
jgi:hypothetical protein